MHCYCTVLFVLVFGAMGYKIKGYNTSRSEAKKQGCNCEELVMNMFLFAFFVATMIA